MIADNLYRFDEAEAYFQRAVGTSSKGEDKSNIWTNWACMLLNKGEWHEAEKMARKALETGTSAKRQMNLGIALLAQRKYREGWPLYDAMIGFGNDRKRQQYKDEQPWDGSPGKRIVVYGEQGLGDEISFASMIPDAVAKSENVILDCSAKLQGLFARSFPKATVYGTRESNAVAWEPGRVDASVPLGGLGKYFRNISEDFPGTPYLVADPERVAMWKGLFAKQGKPVIGIAWTGGMPWTADRFRRWTLDDLLPIFRSVDAVWVSLEYKDVSKEIAAFKAKHNVDLRQYSFGTLTQDYDDTAAMVEALDLVFAMQTAVVHLAGGLGKECWAFVNRHSQWRYAPETMDWYKSVKIYRQGKDWPLERAAADLKAKWKR